MKRSRSRTPAPTSCSSTRRRPTDIAQLRRHCEARTPRPLVAAAGGINAANAADFARAGADVIVTSAPYTARPLDVKVTMEPLR